MELPVVKVTAKAVTAPGQHHALDAEVEHAGPLDHELAEGGEQQGGRGAMMVSRTGTAT